jgi:hypothetical protein
MDENLANLDIITPEAAGDGPVNGTSMPMNRVLRVRILVHGNGAGDSGNIFLTMNRTRIAPLMIDNGQATI